MSARRAWAALAFGGVLTSAALLPLRRAGGQRFDPRRPATLVVGEPRGASPTIRVDARRTGFVRGALPEGPLRLTWQTKTIAPLEQPVLAGAADELVVVASTGDVAFVDPRGHEVFRGGPRGLRTDGAATQLSDGTVVFVAGRGEVVGVRRDRVEPVFVTAIGANQAPRSAPVPLSDGGVVVAFDHALVALDASGGVRARTTLAETPIVPLVAQGRTIFTAGPSGIVHAWTPGGDVRRVGALGGLPDGLVASPSGALVAIVDERRVVDLDPATGTLTQRSTFASGLYLGPPAVRAGHGTPMRLTTLAMTPTQTFVVTLEASGTERSRALVETTSPPSLPDGGAAPLLAPPHVAPLVDAAGTVAFATPSGLVGVVRPDGSVARLGETRLCGSTAHPSAVAGLTPLSERAFVVACRNGTLARIDDVARPNEAPSSTDERRDPLRP